MMRGMYSAISGLKNHQIALDVTANDLSNVNTVGYKGARDAVVFVEGTAFVVSVRNKTVITAVDRDHMRDHVFTNIDSAVIA